MYWSRARHRAAFACAAGLVLSTAAVAQDAVPPLDPESPLAPLPGLGVSWPDLALPDAVEGTAPKATAAATQDERRYAVTLTGLDDLGDVVAQFDRTSVLKEGDGKTANAAQIDRRARDDTQLLEGLLEAKGYYDARIDTAVAPEGDRLAITLAVEPGPRYTFGGVSVTGLTGDAAPFRDTLGIAPGTPVDASTVLAGEAALRDKLARTGYPFATFADPDIAVDHETHQASFALAVRTGEQMRFGKIDLRSQRTPFGPRHIQTIARFRPGQLYDQEKIDDLRRALIATGLVSTVTLTPVRAGPGTVDIATSIERAPVHTIAGELGYGTGEGFRLEASWQHRNLIRPEGAVTFRGVAGTKEQLLGATLRMGNFWRRDQVLNGSIVASHDRRAAYDARSFDIAANLERQTNIIWQKKWTYSFGVELLATDERDYVATAGIKQRRTYLIAALPLTLGYDGSDDLLDPTRGYRLSARVSPELASQNRAYGYVRTQLDASAYQPLGGKVVIAGRARLGITTGASRESIAPSRLFYAGGGGSVRGYGYQQIGPRNVLGEPIGGRSLTEFSLESRIRFGNFGIVPFLDAGNIYTGSIPKLGGFRFGTGIGARYYSSFGPIRIDVGTPIGRRPGETRVAVYVSLGQAF